MKKEKSIHKNNLISVIYDFSSCISRQTKLVGMHNPFRNFLRRSVNGDNKGKFYDEHADDPN